MSTVRRVSLLLVLAGLIGTAGLGNAPAQTKGKTAPKPAETKTAESPTAAGALTFEVYKDAGGKFRWRCKNAEDVNLGMASRGYDNKADCLKTIEAIKAGAARAKIDDQAK